MSKTLLERRLWIHFIFKNRRLFDLVRRVHKLCISLSLSSNFLPVFVSVRVCFLFESAYFNGIKSRAHTHKILGFISPNVESISMSLIFNIGIFVVRHLFCIGMWWTNFEQNTIILWRLNKFQMGNQQSTDKQKEDEERNIAWNVWSSLWKLYHTICTYIKSMVNFVEIHKMQPKPMQIPGIGCSARVVWITYGIWSHQPMGRWIENNVKQLIALFPWHCLNSRRLIYIRKKEIYWMCAVTLNCNVVNI